MQLTLLNLFRSSLCLLIPISFLQPSYAQTYEGNVEFTSQSALNSWWSGWKTVTGNIYITSLATDVITDLAPLQNLEIVGGALIVSENHSLLSLTGLHRIKSAAAVEISFNDDLTSVDGLNALLTVPGPFSIISNTSLPNLNGLNHSLTIGGDLSIRNNPALVYCNASAVCNFLNNHSEFTYLNVSNNAGSCYDITALDAACNAVLPVTLTDFNATREGNAVHITWITTLESNAFNFEIEQSRNGREWQKAGSVEASGESLARLEYHFSDLLPFPGENLYRLKMNDLDGSFAYSTVRSVHVDYPHLAPFPNPVSERLFIPQLSKNKVQSLEIFDMQGFRVFNSKNELPESIPVKSWKNGSYIVKWTDNKGVPGAFHIVKNE